MAVANSGGGSVSSDSGGSDGGGSVGGGGDSGSSDSSDSGGGVGDGADSGGGVGGAVAIAGVAETGIAEAVATVAETSVEKGSISLRLGVSGPLALANPSISAISLVNTTSTFTAIAGIGGGDSREGSNDLKVSCYLLE